MFQMKGVTIKVFLFCGLLMANAASAQSWTLTQAPSKSWTSVASSADGKTLAAAIGNEGLYLSTNSGATWQTNVLTIPTHVMISADGTVLVALLGEDVFVSTNGGGNWQTNSPIGQDDDVMACSADGTKLVVGNPAGNGGHLFTSTNGGLSWASNMLAGANWTGIVSSADGTKLFAVANNRIGGGTGFVFTSTNGGITWKTNVINSVNQSWASAASSADGTKLAAGLGGAGGTIYTSPDGGNTWISNSLPNYEWNSMACSADGSRLIACSEGYKVIYTSTNFGLAWISNAVPAGLAWNGVASSADGNNLVAVDNGGGIYTLQARPAPQLNIATANGNLAFSWTVPTTNFVLQQASDLSTGAWTTLTNLPVLNLTNLQEQISILPTNGNGFFRLVAQ
jgi:hypothetical protein